MLPIWAHHASSIVAWKLAAQQCWLPKSAIAVSSPIWARHASNIWHEGLQLKQCVLLNLLNLCCPFGLTMLHVLWHDSLQLNSVYYYIYYIYVAHLGSPCFRHCGMRFRSSTVFFVEPAKSVLPLWAHHSSSIVTWKFAAQQCLKLKLINLCCPFGLTMPQALWHESLQLNSVYWWIC